jgi:uncharacterized protein YutE (UPF0331/DUF86 family)
MIFRFSALESKMAMTVGFRNIIAHDYEKINYDIVYSILQKGLKDIEDFLEKTYNFIKQ